MATVAVVAGWPLRVSLLRTLATAVPPAAPLATVPASLLATIGRRCTGVLVVAVTGVVISAEVTPALLTMLPLAASAWTTV